MNGFASRILPIILIFFLGHLFRRLRLFDKNTADLFLKTVFYVTLPAMIIKAVSTAEIKIEYIYLPFLPLLVVFPTYLVARLVSGRLNMNRIQTGTFLVGSMIMNTGFCLPFIIAGFGDRGLAIYTIFDFGNSFLIMTFIYFIAVRYGSSSGKKINPKKFLYLPPLWGMLIGFVLNFGKVALPETIMNFLNLVGTPTMFLLMFSLGLYFEIKSGNVSKIILVIFIRIGIGFLIGQMIINLFGFQGDLRAIILISCAAPVGYNTLVFSSLEKLDRELAADLVSISILMGLIYVPLLIYLSNK